MKQSVTIDGVEYKSRTAAAKALVAGGMGLGEVAEKVGMTYQTVYANTTGLEKVKGRRAKYRILKLGKTGNKSAGEIAKKVGVSSSRVVAILKKANITVISAEVKAKAVAAAKAAKAAEKDAKIAAKPAKAPKAPKAPKVTESVTASVEPTAEVTPVVADVPVAA
jgi:transposase